MPEESAKTQGATSAEAESPRGKSTIDFPYLDLDNAVEIAQGVRNVGGDQCEWHQLAAKLSVTPDGGGFRMRMLTAKTFGLLTYERGSVRLTELGKAAADSLREKRARYDAFMTVGLYKQLFDRLSGQTIPPAAAIERMMEQLGVAPKQKEKARQVFQRSAKQAGLLELASDRLTTPPGLSGPQRDSSTRDDIEDAGPRDRGGGGDGGDGSDTSKIPSAILGLLSQLPPAGTSMSQKKRDALIAAFTATVGFIYPDKDDE